MIKRPLPVIGCAYLISLAVVFLYTSFGGQAYRPQVLYALAAAVPVGAGFACLLLRPNKNRLRVVLAAAVLFSFGIVHAQYRTAELPRQASVLYGQKAVITAALRDTAGVSGSRYHYVVQTTQIAQKDPDTGRYTRQGPQNVRMRLTVPAPLDAVYGDLLTAEVNITPPYPVVCDNPYMIRDPDGIMAFCYAYGDIGYQSPRVRLPQDRLRALRDRVNSAVRRAVGGEQGLVAAAFLTGDTSDVPPEILERFRVTGLSHLLAVSGLHVTILAQFFLWLLALIRCPRRLSGILCMVLLLLFTAFTGFTASVARAAVMASALFAARLFHRRHDAANSITFAALLLCVVNPAALLSLSFVLSFAATLAILVLAPALDALCKRAVPWLWSRGRWAVQGATLSLSATLFTYPVTAAVFGSVSVVGPLVNVLVLPLVPVLTVLVFFTGALGAFAPEAVTRIPGLASRAVMLVLLRITDWFAGISFAAVPVGAAAVCFVAAFSVLCGAGYRLAKRRRRFAPALFGVAVAFALTGFWFARAQSGTDIVLAFPDSETSQTAVVHSGGHAAVLTGTDTKKRASGAGYYLRDNALTLDLLFAPSLTDASAAAVRETLRRAPAAQTLLAQDTIRIKELLAENEDAKALAQGGVTSHTLPGGASCLVDRRQSEKAALLLRANGVSVLFVYQGADAARLAPEFLQPDVCVVSGKLPRNFYKIRARYCVLSGTLRKKHAELLTGRAVLVQNGENPLTLRCGEGGILELEDAAIDVYR